MTSAKVKEFKPVTVTLMPTDEAYCLPKDKERKKLRAKGCMNCCSFSKDDSEETVKNKLLRAFPSYLKNKDIVFLQVTKSGDLFRVKGDSEDLMDGERILGLIGAGGLYITIPGDSCSISEDVSVSNRSDQCTLQQPAAQQPRGLSLSIVSHFI